MVFGTSPRDQKRLRIIDSKIDIFKTETKTNLKIDEQIRILLSCVNDPRMRAELYNYWQEVQKDKEYSEKEFFNNLLNDRLLFDE